MSARPRPLAQARAQPGRTCPVSYRYSPRVFDRSPDLRADTLYVVGGLYGNVEALVAVEALAAREGGPVAVVFNGDFHWFDVAPADFLAIEEGVARHHALRGNVETEIAGEDSGAGCGCAYPADVSDAVVSRSNEILERLRLTARGAPGVRTRLAALPMHLVAAVGLARVGIVHGDATSLAGWGFDRARLEDPAHGRWVDSMFEQAKVDVFASTHTCDAALARFARGVVANNGAAGMPNRPAQSTGLLTRISTHPLPGIAGEPAAGVHVQLLPIGYDREGWMHRFLASWPAGSPAHLSYHARIAGS